MTKVFKLSGRDPQQIKCRLGILFEAILARHGSILGTEVLEVASEQAPYQATVRFQLGELVRRAATPS